ncbi:MAG TPA: hypothetical protein VLE89_04545 [Chlamydiales bacterium]|nr:hypothetical protein [Chlamydiales bacterium]
MSAAACSTCSQPHVHLPLVHQGEVGGNLLRHMYSRSIEPILVVPVVDGKNMFDTIQFSQAHPNISVLHVAADTNRDAAAILDNMIYYTEVEEANRATKSTGCYGSVAAAPVAVACASVASISPRSKPPTPGPASSPAEWTAWADTSDSSASLPDD